MSMTDEEIKNICTKSVHVLQFYKPIVRAITVMCVNRSETKIALARVDKTIEIWDVQYRIFLQHMIYLNEIAEDLKYYNDRLFSCGKLSCLNEFDLLLNTPKQRTLLTGGTAWCMDVCYELERIACGTEQGYVNILKIDGDGVEFEKLIDKQIDRVLSIAWSKDGTLIATGSTQYIRVFRFRTGEAIHRMTTPDSSPGQDTLVWRLLFDSYHTLISIDISGTLSFWDADQGVLQQKFLTQDCQLLALAMSSDEYTVYVSGSDAVVSSYTRLPVQGKPNTWNWVRSAQLHGNAFVVHTIVCKGPRVFTGGKDGFLRVSNKKNTFFRYPPLLKNPCISFTKSKKVLMLHAGQLQVWQLDDTHDMTLLLAVDCSQLRTLLEAAISPSARYIAYSDSKKLRFIAIDLADQSPGNMTIKRTARHIKVESCTHLSFLVREGVELCAAVSRSHELHIFQMHENDVESETTISLTERGIVPPLLLLAVSENGKHIAVASQSSVCVLETKSWTTVETIKLSTVPPTAIGINDDLLLVAFSNMEVYGYDVSFSSLAPMSYIDGYQYDTTGMYVYIKGILFDNKASCFIMYSDCAIHSMHIANKAVANVERYSQLDDMKTIEANKYIVALGMINENCDLGMIRARMELMLEDLQTDRKRRFRT